MPKALIVGNTSSGIYDFRNELIVRLLEEGFEVVTVISDDFKAKELSEEGCRVVQIKMNRRGVNPIEDLTLFRAYKELIKKEKPDVVLTYTIKPTIYGGYACRRLKVPYICTVTGLGSVFERKGMLLKITTMMYKVALKSCRCLVFQNRQNLETFAGVGIKAKKTIVVNGSGVNLLKHFFEEYPGHRDDVTRFLYLGRLMVEKGSEELLYCAEKLHEKYGDRVSFVAAGYPEDSFAERIKEATDKGVIKVIPYQKDVHPLIREADAIVHPSYHEGMSNVLMEAAATGRPVITTDISGCREVVDKDVSGFLCTPRDKTALLDALEKFMALDENNRKKMGAAGRKWVEAHFNRERIVDTYMDEIRNCI